MTCALLLGLVLCGCGAADPDGRASAHGKLALATNPLMPGATAPAAPASSPAAAAGAGAAKRPNIVFLLTDDLAWNLVPYMPHVLAMERHGETFSNYFVTDSLCCPSRASIFSGRFPHNTQVTSNSPPYGGFSVFHERGEERHTFATSLQGVGYRTAMMGKYLNGYQPGGEDAGGVLQPASPQPPGWSEWDVAGNGYSEFGYRLNENGQA